MSQVKTQSFDASDLDKLVIHTQLSEIILVSAESDRIEVTHSLWINGERATDMQELEYEVNEGRASLREVRPTVNDINDVWRNSDGQIEGSFQTYGQNPAQVHSVKSILEVRVPDNLTLEATSDYGAIKGQNLVNLVSVESTYGLVEMIFDDSLPHDDLKLISEYAEVDLTLPDHLGAQLFMATEHGDLLSDFDMEIDVQNSQEDVYLKRVMARLNGGGTRIYCSATYSNIYVRKAK
ncbi:MAG: hypothetical protein AAF741_07225 [Bacteroidota bacterium]